MVVPGRRFGKPWLAIYKYNHLCYVEIFGNQKGEDCRKTEKWKYLEGEKVSNMVVVVCPLQPGTGGAEEASAPLYQKCGGGGWSMFQSPKIWVIVQNRPRHRCNVPIKN